MTNPGGNYAGRQMFVGGLKSGFPAVTYLGFGRSRDSQQRYATPFLPAENSIRIKPVDPSVPFDPFRHYQAVRIDQATGLAVVSNNQAPVDPVFEAYKFMTNEEKLPQLTHSRFKPVFLEELLGVIGPEYDNREKPTPRIVGVVFPLLGEFIGALGITRQRGSAFTQAFNIRGDGKLVYVQTYNGDVDYKSFNPELLLADQTIFETSAKTAQELADELWEMSDYVDPQYGELRVWCIAGVRNGNGPGGWELARRNRHNVE